MLKRVKIYLHCLCSTALFCLGLLAIFTLTAHAQGALGNDWSQFLGGWLPGFQGKENMTGETLIIGFIHNTIRIVKYIVGTVAAIFGILYAMNFVFSGGKEETMTKQKKNFMGIVIAFVLLMIGDAIANIFNPETSTIKQLIDFKGADDQLRYIANYLKWLFGSIFVLLITISGLRMMTAQGEEEVLTKQKRNIVWIGIGMLIMLLASNIVNAIYVINEGVTERTPQETGVAVGEIVGVIRLILVFLGPLAVLMTIYAGFMYLTSLDNEERVTKARRMIIAGIIAIVVIYAAYAIVNTIVGGNFVPEAVLPLSELV